MPDVNENLTDCERARWKKIKGEKDHFCRSENGGILALDFSFGVRENNRI